MILPRHTFGIDYTLDCVVRLVEIVKRYEHLVAHLQSQPAGVPYAFGGPETVKAYLRRVEVGIYTEALTWAEGSHTDAAKLVGSPYLIHFMRALQRVGLKKKYQRPVKSRT